MRIFGYTTETDLGTPAYFSVAYLEAYGVMSANQLASQQTEFARALARLALVPAGWLDLAAETGARGSRSTVYRRTVQNRYISFE